MIAEQLARELGKIDDERKKLLARAKREDRIFTSAEESRIDEMNDGADTLLRQAKAIRRAEDSSTELAVPLPCRSTQEAPTVSPTTGASSFRVGSESLFIERGWKPVSSFGCKPEDLQHFDDGGFRDMGEFLRAIKKSGSGLYDKRLQPFDSREHLSQSGGEGSEGGFAFPPMQEKTLFVSAAQQHPYLDRRRLFQIVGDELRIPVLRDEDRSSSDIAGVKLTRTPENATLAETNYVIGQDKLPLTKSGTFIRASNEVIEDSVVGVAETIADIFGRALGMLQSGNFVNGLGAGEPLGLLKSQDLVTLGTSTSAGSIDVADIVGMMAVHEVSDPASAFWLMNRSVMLPLASMTLAADTTPIWSPNAMAALSNVLYGLPVHYSDACPTSNTKGDLILTDASQYAYGLGRVSIQADSSFAFDRDQTVWRLTIRDAGQPLRSTTGTSRQGVTTASTVILATRS